MQWHDGAGEEVEYRPGFGRALAVGVLVVCALAVGATLLSHPSIAWRYVPPAALVVVCVWAAYWWPAVLVTPGGVVLRNVTRTIELPWPSIQRIDTKFALTLFTAYGSYSAWAAPAPGRMEVARAGGGVAAGSEGAGLPESAVSAGTIAPGDLPSSPSGAAAALVRRRWEQLRDDGALDNPRLERANPVVRWHWRTLLAIAALAAASAATLLTG